MYSDKENINILTSLLVAHGVNKAVVCPGSRNAPIVHNLNEHPGIECYPVTDERSAGFYALGLAQATRKPVVVCVTSGTALLNLAPSVAEAFYQHIPLVVVSADRPSAWIDQLDGQTLPQSDALGRFVGCAVCLPEPNDDTSRWYCNRLVNEALYASKGVQPQPVHINVPISEPLFQFSQPDLPAQRIVKRMVLDVSTKANKVSPDNVFSAASRPMIIIGQTAFGDVPHDLFEQCSSVVTTLAEPLAQEHGAIPFDEVLHAVGAHNDYMPDAVCYVGDTIVSKRLRKFLRKSGARTVMITVGSNRWADPTEHLCEVVECSDWTMAACVLRSMLADIDTQSKLFYDRWQQALLAADGVKAEYMPKYSQMAAVKYFEEQLEDFETDFFVHYANSSVVRLANIYATHYVWCNRGVNGIEGSLSTAAGFSLAKDDDSFVFCIIGDLSFFYDQNALWNQNLKGNLRIILLNNHGGGIFRQLKGLSDSDAAITLVGAAHNTEAQGICTQNDIGYLKATCMEEMQIGIVTLLTREASRPMVLEIMTCGDDDAEAVRNYYAKVKEKLQN